jgi:FkbH-like protein
MKTFNELKKNLKKKTEGLPIIRIAILGDSATQFFSIALRGQAYESGYNVEIFEADYSQIDLQIFDFNSDLYKFNPKYVIIHHSTNKLLLHYNKLESTHKVKLCNDRLGLIKNLFYNLTENLETKVLYFNYNEIDDNIFGNYANKVEHSFLFQLRKLNYELMQFSHIHSNFHLIDLSSIQNSIGKNAFFQSSLYTNAEITISLEALPHVLFKTVKLIEALESKSKKCLILDLDNTIWGGIIGDDGLDNIQIGNLGIGKAFTEFQYWVKKLQQRGVIIAVCSKNSEAIAKEPFEKHPEMILKLDDISVFIANWENKVDNIKRIQSILNIGFDSMVFLDDNPFERNIVKANLPDITVPELPVDPSLYLEYLYQLNLFETSNYSEADQNRTIQYQVEAQRSIEQALFTDLNDFLKGLNMVSEVSSFNQFTIPRVAQLSQRSNQFNLRTKRYSESEIESILANDNFHTFTFTLKDKYGDNGLVSVVILEERNHNELFIDSWFMSCRILKRGMEEFVFNQLLEYASNLGYDRLVGEYLPTAKNTLVKDLLSNLGFSEVKNSWVLNLKEVQELKECFIQKFKE